MELVLDRVAVRRGDVTIRASAVFPAGIHLVTGPVGAGKTTVALVAAGILPPDEGAVRREGIARSSILFPFPEWHVTERSLREEAGSFGVDATAALSLAGLPVTGGRDPLSLSRGELKRFLLACILLRGDDLLVLDEPYSGLDCPGKAWLCRALEAVRGGGARIAVVCTHERHFLPRADSAWEFSGHTLCRRDRRGGGGEGGRGG
ncbi:MAG: ATP-binding cassette domain-containing protein [Methanolinea sp.]|nr:ATP-binding cassette domain-containing protein [Methanolinea sp.]